MCGCDGRQSECSECIFFKSHCPADRDGVRGAAAPPVPLAALAAAALGAPATGRPRLRAAAGARFGVGAAIADGATLAAPATGAKGWAGTCTAAGAGASVISASDETAAADATARPGEAASISSCVTGSTPATTSSSSNFALASREPPVFIFDHFVCFFSSRARMFSRKHLMPPSTATSLTIDVPSADIGVAQQLRLRCALLLIAHSLPNIPRQRHMIEPFAIPLTHPARADRSLQRGPIVRVENASRLKVTRKVVVLPP